MGMWLLAGLGRRGRCLGEVVCEFWGTRSSVGLWEAVRGTAPVSRRRAGPAGARGRTGAAPPALGAAASGRGRPAALRRPRRAGPPCGCSATAPSSGRWISPTRRSWWGASAATAGASGRAAPTTAGCRAR